MKYTDGRYDRQSSSSSQEPGKTPPMRSKGDFSRDDGPFNNTCSRSNLDSHRIPSTCKIGDRVLFFNKQGEPSEGTVKWIGKSSRARSFEYNYVGIISVSFFFYPFCN